MKASLLKSCLKFLRKEKDGIRFIILFSIHKIGWDAKKEV